MGWLCTLLAFLFGSLQEAVEKEQAKLNKRK